MISLEQQQQLLLSIARRLKKKVTAYAIGGTAMMFHGFKESTLDVDLVFLHGKDRELFAAALLSLGYQKMDALQVYGKKRNTPEMFALDEVRFDLFVVQVVDFGFSTTMQQRATQIREFGETLILKVAHPYDLIIMKCATDRIKDKDDGRKIIESWEVQWKVLLEEIQIQIALGKERAAFELGCFLEDLKYRMKVKEIPKEVLDELFEKVKKQVEEKQKRSKPY